MAREASYVAGFKRESFAELAAIGEVEVVVVGRGDSLVQRNLDALIFVRRNRQRETQRSRDGTLTREGQCTNTGIQTAELWTKRTILHIERVGVDVFSGSE